MVIFKKSKKKNLKCKDPVVCFQNNKLVNTQCKICQNICSCEMDPAYIYVECEGVTFKPNFQKKLKNSEIFIRDDSQFLMFSFTDNF